jgi:hypothetical protein
MPTDLDGGDAEAAGLEHDADAAGRHALAEAAHHPAGHQNILHGRLLPTRTLSSRFLALLRRRNRGNKEAKHLVRAPVCADKGQQFAPWGVRFGWNGGRRCLK